MWSVPIILFSALLIFLFCDLPVLSGSPTIHSDTPSISQIQRMSIPKIYSSENGYLEVELRVSLCRVNISNRVFYTSRCYNGGVPGPTIVVSPGDHIRIHLVNELGGPVSDADITTPNSFRHPNTTSLHLHGLHVSPSDENLYIPCLPGEEAVYDFHLPLWQDPGTFYYHPHYHGSSSLQSLGGMAGALVVRERNYTSSDGTGDSEWGGTEGGGEGVAVVQR